jgi:probable phosphoglycerate mutase
MRIIFVRHGKPDYRTDSLVPIGVTQAHIAAGRLRDEGISEIYASTMGRAMQTAEPTAALLGLPIIPCDFMREISWGNEEKEIILKGHPWGIANHMVSSGMSLVEKEWADKEPFSENSRLHIHMRRVIEGADKWLESLGIKRDGEHYRVTEKYEDKTIAMFSHGGASTVLLSHMFNLPFPMLCSAFRPYFTSICVIRIGGEIGETVSPHIEILSDDRHVPRDDSDGRMQK